MNRCRHCGRFLRHCADGCEYLQLDLFRRQERAARIDARIRLLFMNGEGYTGKHLTQRARLSTVQTMPRNTAQRKQTHETATLTL